ncbi:DUF4783 domain-containing protein [Algoriphagus lutimaris]|uniref:DUF4783 domain-containing protein n=1 Tax=Algoriphagus lutimaris TaxID=613197 RepID=UPI00196B38E7|nr:DUF4783 domain-containing protein [Algoriphagus lutimaris]MBN3521314.1 DUF4783 domain-containing protein [Algoriphagus lutimaris]
MAILNLFFSLLFIFHTSSFEVGDGVSIDPVITAINTNSSSELAKYFESSISLNVNGQQGSYSRNQAEIVIRDFFKKNPSKGFTIVYSSETNPSLSSFIGDYLSGEGTFKVFIKVSQQDSNLKIYSLEFVKG